MNKKKSNRTQNNTQNYDDRSPSLRRRERMKKAVVWVFVFVVVAGLVLSMAPDPSAFMYATQPQ